MKTLTHSFTRITQITQALPSHNDPGRRNEGQPTAHYSTNRVTPSDEQQQQQQLHDAIAGVAERVATEKGVSGSGTEA